MACNDVGSTNPDIAGLGVILSFTIQAGLSFFLSFWSVILQPRYRSRSAVTGQHGQPGDRSIFERARVFVRDPNRAAMNLAEDLQQNRRRAIGRRRITPAGALLIRVKNSGPVRKLIALIPRSVKSLVTMILHGPSDLELEQIQDLWLKIDKINGVLKTISDVQTFNGISLLIGALTQHETLSLYHYHVVYDTVNFTGVSAAAALAAVLRKPNDIALRVVLVLVFLSLYLAFVILFGLKLQAWDSNVTGHCYKASGISTQGALHPYVDNVYVAITALYLFSSMGVAVSSATTGSIVPKLWSSQANTALPVLTVALIQYPVHVYTLFALRSSNEAYLSGDPENQWGFGQVVALVLVASVLLECFRARKEYKERHNPKESGYKETTQAFFPGLLVNREGEQGPTAIQ